ncbi:hypothetical protein VIGAN_08170600 [Vigna angularis var. angularis]|uniref:Uncharacterized protein n=1 Tax=Vigna angularis var. angularis TaxID=157739 RepID=A0A0S3SQL4_PHAAN|nr:hypothetical protein VIGAN_08170600 [Vigna angularis var. angularis]
MEAHTSKNMQTATTVFAPAFVFAMKPFSDSSSPPPSSSLRQIFSSTFPSQLSLPLPHLYNFKLPKASASTKRLLC